MNRKEKNIFLIIDPFLKQPASQALNTISALHTRLLSEKPRLVSHLEFFFPLYSDIEFSELIERIDKEKKKIFGVISLGSYVNVTEGLEWVDKFGMELRTKIIEQSIPFLGICFSHQLLAYIYESDVGYLDELSNAPNNKWDEFREINVVHDKLRMILNGKNSFISKSRHEQEVKGYDQDVFDLICTSPQCYVEGLMHKKYPAFSLQSHPEEWHESGDGMEVLYSFMKYFLELNNN